MPALLDSIVDLAGLVSPGRSRTIASRVRGLTDANSAPAPEMLVATPSARAAVARVFTAWGQHAASGNELAGMLLGASEARRRVEQELSVELVWTGPTTRFVPTRRTEQVLLDLIDGAKSDLFLVSFVAYSVPTVAAALNSASARGVGVRFLLEASSGHGGSLDIDPAAIVSSKVPGAEIFTWHKKPEPFVGGKVHAKVVVADRARAFVTSANITGHALEKNMEAGVLINGGPVPRSLGDHLEALINVGIIAPHEDSS